MHQIHHHQSSQWNAMKPKGWEHTISSPSQIKIQLAKTYFLVIGILNKCQLLAKDTIPMPIQHQHKLDNRLLPYVPLQWHIRASAFKHDTDSVNEIDPNFFVTDFSL